MTNLLNQFKSILKVKNFELFDSYSWARLQQRLVKYHSSEICFDEVKLTNQFVYSSSISVPEVPIIAANYKRELKDRELIDEPSDSKNKVLKRAANIIMSDIENVDIATVHPLDPRSISRVVISENVPSSLKHFLKQNLRGNFK